MTALEHGDTVAIREKIEELIEDLGPEAVTELVQSFIDDAPDTISELREYARLSDHQNLKRSSHSFKSIAQIYGMQEVGHLSQQIESASGREELDAVPKLLHRLKVSYFEQVQHLIDLLRSQYQISLAVPEPNAAQPNP